MANGQKKAKKNNSGSNGKAALYTFGLVALAIVIILASSFFIPNVMMFKVRGLPPDADRSPLEMGMEPENSFGMLMDSGFMLRIALSLVNILLILYLLYVHLKDYLALHSNFTFGLVAFLFSFLLYALSSFPVIHAFFGRFGMASVFSFIPMLFSAIGLIIFAKISNE